MGHKTLQQNKPQVSLQPTPQIATKVRKQYVKNKQTLIQETQQHITSHFQGKPPTSAPKP
jgi:hypothetical protein